jgi:hypothetical protein
MWQVVQVGASKKRPLASWQGGVLVQTEPGLAMIAYRINSHNKACAA